MVRVWARPPGQTKPQFTYGWPAGASVKSLNPRDAGRPSTRNRPCLSVVAPTPGVAIRLLGILGMPVMLHPGDRGTGVLVADRADDRPRRRGDVVEPGAVVDDHRAVARSSGP